MPRTKAKGGKNDDLFTLKQTEPDAIVSSGDEGEVVQEAACKVEAAPEIDPVMAAYTHKDQTPVDAEAVKADGPIKEAVLSTKSKETQALEFGAAALASTKRRNGTTSAAEKDKLSYIDRGMAAAKALEAKKAAVKAEEGDNEEEEEKLEIDEEKPEIDEEEKLEIPEPSANADVADHAAAGKVDKVLKEEDEEEKLEPPIPKPSAKKADVANRELAALEKERPEEQPEEELAASTEATSPAEAAKDKEFVQRFRMAANARGSKTGEWYEASRPKGQGRKTPMPANVRCDFPRLLQAWLKARKLEDRLERDVETEKREQSKYVKGDEIGLRRWLVYKYTQAKEVDPSWVPAYHGTYWYALWSILETGLLLESNDAEMGHDFWEPGTYCTPHMQTALWYARPHIVFNDDVYNRVVIELRVDKSRQKRTRNKGGEQWVFPWDAVALVGVRFKTNAPPKNGEQRLTTWEAEFEALPEKRSAPEVIEKSAVELGSTADSAACVDSEVSESSENEAYIDHRHRRKKLQASDPAGEATDSAVGDESRSKPQASCKRKAEEPKATAANRHAGARDWEKMLKPGLDAEEALRQWLLAQDKDNIPEKKELDEMEDGDQYGDPELYTWTDDREFLHCRLCWKNADLTHVQGQHHRGRLKDPTTMQEAKSQHCQRLTSRRMPDQDAPESWAEGPPSGSTDASAGTSLPSRPAPPDTSSCQSSAEGVPSRPPPECGGHPVGPKRPAPPPPAALSGSHRKAPKRPGGGVSCLKCANPTCSFRVTDQKTFGNFCCKMCHYVWAWAEAGQQPPGKKKKGKPQGNHGEKCSKEEADSDDERADPEAPPEPCAAWTYPPGTYKR